ncbi:11524_t:CDS:1 [Ambispora gerdemannii]|uniref:11524_t:CDS:1 n=1 Tax=Ambispora gerdemannii TaxID=144530 RepID=A0A9N8ZHB0_9GLOM|nr:11524_t:CDS:1 [Ambispora gerdemannii]
MATRIRDYYDLEARWFEKNAPIGGFTNPNGKCFPVTVENLLTSLKYRAEKANVKTLCNYLSGITGYHTQVLHFTNWKEEVRNNQRIKDYIDSLRGSGPIGTIREQHRREVENVQRHNLLTQ